MKQCTKCNIIKPITEYRRDKKGKNGYSARCKVCRREQDLIWYNNNKQRHYELCRKSVLRRKEAVREYNKQYRIKNKEKIDKRTKEWHKNNRERSLNFKKSNKYE